MRGGNGAEHWENGSGAEGRSSGQGRRGQEGAGQGLVGERCSLCAWGFASVFPVT